MTDAPRENTGGPEKSKVLIVDDIAQNIQLLGSNLRGAGYQVIPATSGAQALRAAQTHLPDIILLDVMMPEMNGYEVFAKLRELDETKDIPVIFVTALADETDETKGLELGAVDYITKPIVMPVALARIRTQLQLKIARQQLAEQNQQLLAAAKLKEDVERITRHDMKTPLTTMLFVPQFLKTQANLNPDQVRMLNLAEAAGYRLLNMINHSLDLYKMEVKTYVLNPAEVELLAIIRKIFDELKSLLNMNALSYTIELQGRPVAENDKFTVFAEELLCYSLFANVIKNAAEASPRGETINVTLQQGRPCVIKVRNRGAVPESIRENFFEKYVTAGKEKGTGLGTYSARLMAETQNGAIALDTSEPGCTSLIIQLPAPE